MDLSKLYSPESESAMLGCTLYNETALETALASGLTPEWFYSKSHRLVVEAILALTKRNAPVDAVSVWVELKRTEQDKAFGDYLKYEKIIDKSEPPAHTEHHIGILKDFSRRRQIVNTCECASAKAFDCKNNPDSLWLTGQIESEFLALGEDPSQKQPANRDWSSDVERCCNNFCARIEKGASAYDGIPTGFGKIDEIMGGLRPGEVTILAARPSVGKTSLAMNILVNVARAKHTVGLFSLEMTCESLIMREIYARSGVTRDKMQLAGIADTKSEEVCAKVKAVAAELKALPIVYNDTSCIDLLQMRSDARRMIRRKGVELIVIDYLQLITNHEGNLRNQTTTDFITAISAGIKAMARELKVPVLALSQLSRPTKNKDDPESLKSDGCGDVKLSDLRGSGAIEQDADVVLLMHRKATPTPDDEVAVVVNVAKNRNGSTGKDTLYFEPKETRFYEMNRTERAEAKRKKEEERKKKEAAERAKEAAEKREE